MITPNPAFSRTTVSKAHPSKGHAVRAATFLLATVDAINSESLQKASSEALTNKPLPALGKHFIRRKVDLVKVKGQKPQVPIFELLGAAPPDSDSPRFLHPWSRILSFLMWGWEESLNALASALRLCSQVRHCHRYHSQTQKYQVEPLLPAWQEFSGVGQVKV